MLRRRLILLVATLLLVAGCSKDTKSPAGGSAASTGDCKTVISDAFVRAAHAGMEAGATKDGTKVDPQLRAEMDRIGKDLDAKFKPMAEAVAAVCVSDKWSAEMLACVRKASTGDAFDACNLHLDATQRQHLEDATRAADSRAQQSASPVCMKYADFEIKCAGAGEDARSTILDFCAKARAGAKEITYQLIALESSCAETAADCDAYKTCVEQKKRDASPTP
jgi:hypothetical protein